MAKGNNKKIDLQKSDTTSQTSIDALLLAFNKRRLVIFIAFVIIFLCGAIFYSLKSPIYESTILLKKQEQPKDQNVQDQYLKLVANQSSDDIETELQLINTRVVLSRVVNQLKLNFVIDDIQFPGGKKIDIQRSLTPYGWWLKDKGEESLDYPQVLDAQVDSIDDAAKLNYYVVYNDGYIELYNTETNKLINSKRSGNPSEISSDGFHLKIDWNKSPRGTKVYFTISYINKMLPLYSYRCPKL